MILDLEKFIEKESHSWRELERLLKIVQNKDGSGRLSLPEIDALHRLYERTCADLAKLQTYAAEDETSRYLESLVAQVYGEINEIRQRKIEFSFIQWITATFPRTFRKHIHCFYLSFIVMLVGSLFGAGALLLDFESKSILMPFSHLMADPAERVMEEEDSQGEQTADDMTAFSARLMVNNIRVSLLTLALGATYGLGTLLILFYNGTMLGAVAADYIAAGQIKFLLGWLLPHGSVEIPSIILAGQAGLVLARALIGQGRSESLARRLQSVRHDLWTLVLGIALLLVWAGLVEAFFSQYHEPILPYSVKILFGTLQLFLLFFYLFYLGSEIKLKDPSDALLKTPIP